MSAALKRAFAEGRRLVAVNCGGVALPVVDENGRALGMVTVDDVIDAIQEEQTESVQRFGGLEALDESYTQTGFAEMVRKRVGWLSVLFVGGMFTTLAMKPGGQPIGALERGAGKVWAGIKWLLPKPRRRRIEAPAAS